MHELDLSQQFRDLELTDEQSRTVINRLIRKALPRLCAASNLGKTLRDFNVGSATQPAHASLKEMCVLKGNGDPPRSTQDVWAAIYHTAAAPGPVSKPTKIAGSQEAWSLLHHTGIDAAWTAATQYRFFKLYYALHQAARYAIRRPIRKQDGTDALVTLERDLRKITHQLYADLFTQPPAAAAAAAGGAE